MHKIIIAGGGKIGSLIAILLAKSGDYDVTVIDKNFSQVDITLFDNIVNLKTQLIDIEDSQQMITLLTDTHFDTIVSSLPYYCNITIAEYAKIYGLNYFDLTEDNQVADTIKKIAENAQTVFVPRCGLAPGFIGLCAMHLMEEFDKVRSARLRVGALPINSNNALQYGLTWSTEGLINQYSNPCHALAKGKRIILQPLEGLEIIKLDGVTYEAFSTSGGIGNIVDLLAGKVETINYKTIRYPGHRQVMYLLMYELFLENDKPALKKILETAIPKIDEDVVIIYVAMIGYKQDKLVERNYVNKIYSRELFGLEWSAMQLTTASSVCAVVDLILQNKKLKGFYCQEMLDYREFVQNRFGKIFEQQGERL